MVWCSLITISEAIADSIADLIAEAILVWFSGSPMRTTKSKRTAAYYRRVEPSMVSVLDGVLFGSAANGDSGRFEGGEEAGGGSGTGGVAEGLKSNAEGVSGAAEEGLRKEVERLELENAMLKAENERLIAAGVGVDAKLEEEVKVLRKKVKDLENYGA